jgi:hypothetical protein
LKGALFFLVNTIVEHSYLMFQLVIVGVGMQSLFRKRLKKGATSFHLVELSLAIITGLVIISLTPFPLYEQYFTSPFAPLVVPVVGVGITFLWERGRTAVFICLFLAMLLSFREFSNEHMQSSITQGWEVSALEIVAANIRNHTVETDTVISPWPGYACESGRRFFPGLENQFALPVAARLTAAEQHRYRITGMDSIITAIENGNAKMVVIGVWVNSFLGGLGESERKRFNDALEARYQLEGEIGNVFSYVRKGR